MSENFYEEKLKEIRKAIADGDFKLANNLLTEELKMPYIPQIYENQFKELFTEVIRNLMTDEGRKQVPLEEQVEMLFGEDGEQLMAIEMLKDANVRPVKDEIKNRIETYSKDEALKRTFLFELLAEQEIAIEIEIEGQKLDPTKHSITKNEEVKRAIDALPYVVAKHPQMYEPVFNELQRYFLMKFPEVPQDGKLLVEQIYNIVLSMFEADVVLTEQEKEIFDFLNKG